MKNTQSQFQLFRYQILPIDRYIQGDLLSGIDSIDELLEKKNEYFADALENTERFVDSRNETLTKKLYSDGEFFLYRLAANRSLHRETEEFTEESIDNWPSVLAAVWNQPDIQMIAVQKRTTAFQQSETVAKLILHSLSNTLANHHLMVQEEPLFDKKEFWELIEKHKGKVKKLEFEFLTPNMANISGELPENLKEFAKRTNSIKNKLEVESDNESSLHVNTENESINGLVNYSSEGGGNITIKVDGISKKIHTSSTVKEIEIGDMQLQGSSEEIANILKELMK